MYIRQVYADKIKIQNSNGQYNEIMPKKYVIKPQKQKLTSFF